MSKPNGPALAAIVNYRDPLRARTQIDVPVGHVRYASTNRGFQGIDDVEVSMSPDDLLAQKTALFGMTRTGKSNTTKIILQSVFELRFAQSPIRVGQLVFDPNGEYANENVQDAGSIKNIWRTNQQGSKDDVVTYGITRRPSDPDRRLMLLNFFWKIIFRLAKRSLTRHCPKTRQSSFRTSAPSDSIRQHLTTVARLPATIVAYSPTGRSL